MTYTGDVTCKCNVFSAPVHATLQYKIVRIFNFYGKRIFSSAVIIFIYCTVRIMLTELPPSLIITQMEFNDWMVLPIVNKNAEMGFLKLKSMLKWSEIFFSLPIPLEVAVRLR